MKKFIVLFVFCIAHQSFAAGGGESGGGGDAVVADFISYAKPALEDALSTATTFQFEGQIIQIQELIELLKTANIGSTNDDLKVGSRSVDAKNWPDDKKILISRSRWNELMPIYKRRLSIHELVSLNRKDDSNYAISDLVAAQAKLSYRCYWSLYSRTDSKTNIATGEMPGVKSGDTIMHSGSYNNLSIGADVSYSEEPPTIDFYTFEGEVAGKNNLFRSNARFTGYAWIKYPSQMFPGDEIYIACSNMDCKNKKCSSDSVTK